MNPMFFMIPVMAFVGLSLILALVWAVKSGQFEDIENQKYRIFFED